MTVLEAAASHYWTSGDGAALHYRDTGTAGPWCILLHGLADGEYIWSEVAESLGRSYRLLAIDLRGHGRSGWSAGGSYHLESFTRDVIDLIRALNVTDPVIVGHSLGGDITAQMTSTHDLSPRAVVLVDSGPRSGSGDYKLIKSEMLGGCRDYDDQAHYLDWLRQSRPLASDSSLNRLAALSLAGDKGGFHLRLDPKVLGILETEEDDSWWWKALRTIRCPILIVRGSASGVLTNVTAQRMLSVARNARLRIVPGAGHGVMTDNPSGFVGVISRFLDEAEAARSKEPAADVR